MNKIAHSQNHRLSARKALDLADIAIVIPSDDTSRIQELHLALEHLIVEAVEEELAT